MLFLDEQQIYVMQYLKVVKESYICICIYDNEITDDDEVNSSESSGLSHSQLTIS